MRHSGRRRLDVVCIFAHVLGANEAGVASGPILAARLSPVLPVPRGSRRLAGVCNYVNPRTADQDYPSVARGLL